MKIRTSQNGLTLLEILVAISILSVILGVIYTTFFSASRTAKMIESDEDVYQTARSLFEMISLELRSFSYDSNTFFGLNGTSNEINFLSSSHRRKGVDSREGNMAEIGYFIEADGTGDTSHLIKIVDPSVDSDFSKGGTYFPLSDQVKSLEFEYLKMEKDVEEWMDDWDSEEQQEIPDQIRIRLSVLNDADEAVTFRSIIHPNVGK